MRDKVAERLPHGAVRVDDVRDIDALSADGHGRGEEMRGDVRVLQYVSVVNSA